MLESLPSYIDNLFILATLISVYLFYQAACKRKLILVICFFWLGFHAILSINGFYKVTNTLPPRFALLAPPAILFLISLFFTSGGKKFIDNLDLKVLTYLHSVRILVEVILYWLYQHQVIPQLMTFEGRNFDILAGVTAPLVAYYGFGKGKLSKKIIIIWNVICLCLLLNIVVTAILSAPSRFQQLAFDQPNVAIEYFPYVWLAACIVPLVLFAHLVALRRLTK